MDDHLWLDRLGAKVAARWFFRKDFVRNREFYTNSDDSSYASVVQTVMKATYTRALSLYKVDLQNPVVVPGGTSFGIIEDESITETLYCRKCCQRLLMQVFVGGLNSRHELVSRRLPESSGISLVPRSGVVTVPVICFNCGVIGKRKYVSPGLQMRLWNLWHAHHKMVVSLSPINILFTGNSQIIPLLCPENTLSFLVIYDKKGEDLKPMDRHFLMGSRIYKIFVGRYPEGVAFPRVVSCCCCGPFRLVFLKIVAHRSPEQDFHTQWAVDTYPSLADVVELYEPGQCVIYDGKYT
ncbi:hypothetical protein QAD02_008212 [Eretmocerus hayati]|uniref:Uncharacterized protein n=1 Tax=Eretmocerus hayati TaxID=131215 RepID=A0ACC2N5T4_9HYME|nr:hypothetical protein QAD02_008212 [Eretmocerus hayati]